MDNSHISKFKLFFSLDKELAYINKMNREGWKLIYIKGGVIYSFEKSKPDEYFTILHATAKENAATKPYRIRWTVSVICCISPAERQMFRLNLFVKHLKKLTAQKEYIIVSELSALFLSYCPFYLFWIVRLSFGQG